MTFLGRPTVLIWAERDDPTSEGVVQSLNRLRTPWIGLDGRGIRHAGRQRPQLGKTGWLEDITAVLVRPGCTTAAPGSSLARRYQALSDRLWHWLDRCEALVLNRPRASLSNEAKPFQLSYLRAAGFHVPHTLLTTDPSYACEFARRFDALVVKSISGERSIVRKYTDLDQVALAKVANCPTMFQEFVAGTDVRVHVVGEQIFGHAIESAAVDYRYAGRTGHARLMQQVAVPDHVAEACLAVARELELWLAGIDLRRTRDGRWFAFEVNPAPAFAFFEEEVPIGIADAVATLLSSPTAHACAGRPSPDRS